MFATNKKMHSARFVTKSTNYYFLIEPITGWLLRPIFRLILTGCIYSRYMYAGQDGIEHFTMLIVMRAYTSYVLYIGSSITKHLQTKVPKVHSNLSIESKVIV